MTVRERGLLAQSRKAGLFFLWKEYGSDCTLGLLFRLDLPVGYLLGAYTDGAYLLGGGFIRAQLMVSHLTQNRVCSVLSDFGELTRTSKTKFSCSACYTSVLCVLQYAIGNVV